MSQVALNGVVILRGVDLSCYLKSVKISGDGEVLDQTTLCSTGSKSWAVGLIDRTVSAQGFYKRSATESLDLDGLFNEAMDDPDSDFLISVAEEGGGAAGSIGVLGNIKMAKYDIDTVIGQLLSIAFETKATKTQSAAHLYPAYWLVKEAITVASTLGTSVDMGAGFTGYVCNIHNYDGDDDITVQLQHSSNNSTWANLGSAQVVNLNTASQIVDTSTSVNRYVRAVLSPGGTSTSVGVTFKPTYSG